MTHQWHLYEQRFSGLELILVVDHHHGVLIIVISLEAGHTDHSSSVFLILPKLSRQWAFSTASTPAINGARYEHPATAGSEFNGLVSHRYYSTTSLRFSNGTHPDSVLPDFSHHTQPFRILVPISSSPSSTLSSLAV